MAPQDATDQYDSPLDPLHAILDEHEGAAVACHSGQQAVWLAAAVYEMFPDREFHIESTPITDDDAGSVEFHRLTIRPIHYEYKEGWFSTDVPESPEFDVDFRDYHA